jgi:hypothetical protein
MDKEILLVYYYGTDTHSGIVTKEFYTISEAYEYIGENPKENGMIEPKVYRLIK